MNQARTNWGGVLLLVGCAGTMLALFCVLAVVAAAFFWTISSEPSVAPLARPSPPEIARNIEPSVTTSPPINLLAGINVSTDVVQGEIRRENGILITSGGRPDLATLPTEVPLEYDLELQVTRTLKPEGIMVGLVVDGRQCMVTIDGFPESGFRSGLDLIDGIRIDNPRADVVKGPLLKNDQLSTILCQVRRRSVTVLCDQRPVVQWQGDPSRLSLFPLFDVPDENMLFVGSWEGHFRISKIMLTPVAGEN